MREIILTGENYFQNEEGKKYLLKYYIVKELKNIGIKKPLFGVAIYKYDITTNEKFIEKEESTAISLSFAIVKKMTEQLMHFKITPVCLLEILDDLISQHLEESLVL